MRYHDIFITKYFYEQIHRTSLIYTLRDVFSSQVANVTIRDQEISRWLHRIIDRNCVYLVEEVWYGTGIYFSSRESLVCALRHTIKIQIQSHVRIYYARLLSFAFTIISCRAILMFNRAMRGRDQDNRHEDTSLINFLQGFRGDFSPLRLDLNRPSLPSSLPFGAEIINRSCSLPLWVAGDAVGLSRKRGKKKRTDEKGRNERERKGEKTKLGGDERSTEYPWWNIEMTTCYMITVHFLRNRRKTGLVPTHISVG